MDITEATGQWRVTGTAVENRKTGEITQVRPYPCADKIAHMHQREFMKQCEHAFNTGDGSGLA